MKRAMMILIALVWVAGLSGNASEKTTNPAPAQSAASDDNERVRAFSTRELGKLKRADLAPAFTQLLDDKSPFVRQNAAWALGELSAGDEGRAAARQAIAELRQVVKHDPAGEVRAAARTTLDRIE